MFLTILLNFRVLLLNLLNHHYHSKIQILSHIVDLISDLSHKGSAAALIEEPSDLEVHVLKTFGLFELVQTLCFVDQTLGIASALLQPILQQAHLLLKGFQALLLLCISHFKRTVFTLFASQLRGSSSVHLFFHAPLAFMPVSGPRQIHINFSKI